MPITSASLAHEVLPGRRHENVSFSGSFQVMP